MLVGWLHRKHFIVDSGWDPSIGVEPKRIART